MYSWSFSRNKQTNNTNIHKYTCRAVVRVDFFKWIHTLYLSSDDCSSQLEFNFLLSFMMRLCVWSLPCQLQEKQQRVKNERFLIQTSETDWIMNYSQQLILTLITSPVPTHPEENIKSQSPQITTQTRFCDRTFQDNTHPFPPCLFFLLPAGEISGSRFKDGPMTVHVQDSKTILFRCKCFSYQLTDRRDNEDYVIACAPFAGTWTQVKWCTWGASCVHY